MSGRPSRGAARRRRAIAAGIALAIVAGAALALSNVAGSDRPSSGQSAQASRSSLVRIRLDGRTLAAQPAGSLAGARPQAALIGAAPATSTIRRGRATIWLRTDRGALARGVRHAVERGAGTVVVPRKPTASSIRIPVIKQALRDDCEATALAMMLSFAGKRLDQLTLQDQVARSGPLDPRHGPTGEVWGDPNLGFVGRADGGGAGGGYGVYQGPIAALARRHGVVLHELSQKSPQSVYSTLLSGHPVMAWIALSSGPYASWRSPSGRIVRVNYGEHTVVLVGTAAGTVTFNDPLSGRRLTWSKNRFEAMWASLGRRALAA